MTIIFEKEIMEKDVLNRLKWDKNITSKDFSLTYEDRFKHEEQEINITDILYDGEDFFGITKLEEDGTKSISQIPLHRIRTFKNKGKIVWSKRKK